MKEILRRSVFETNSSSVHTLTIAKEGLEPSNLPMDAEGRICISYGQFGKETRIYTSQIDKLKYLLTSLKITSGCYGINNVYPYERIKEWICEYAGATDIYIDDREEPYIDHQSCPYCESDIIINVYDKQSVIDFVFNKYVMLHTTCD